MGEDTKYLVTGLAWAGVIGIVVAILVYKAVTA